MPENTVISPFLGAFMTSIFIFSTVWGLAFFYFQGTNQQMSTSGISDTPNDPMCASKNSQGVCVGASSSGFFGFLISVVDGVLEFLSWISPFALVKLIFIEVTKDIPFVYQVLNIFILRPVGWVITIFEVNYIISRIPTEHGEI